MQTLAFGQTTRPKVACALAESEQSLLLHVNIFYSIQNNIICSKQHDFFFTKNKKNNEYPVNPSFII